jgi:8-oxo-dGTP pyrophosphatase MutT (NUDIX family)
LSGRRIDMTVTPVNAATVILLRPAAGHKNQRFEVLMVQRNSKSAFAPGAYVFPGGRVDESDCAKDMDNFYIKRDLLKVLAALDDVSFPEKAPGIPIAAIRETLEEAGFLMARQKDGTPLSLDRDYWSQRLHSYRETIRSGEMNFAQLFEREELILAIEQLHYFSHWITPELSPIRYNTRFFVAEVPVNHQASHDGHELTGHVWITPEQALARYREKKFHMVVPTIVTLEELSRFAAIGDVIESTKGKKITAVLTLLVFKDNEFQEQTPDGRIFRNLIA